MDLYRKLYLVGIILLLYLRKSCGGDVWHGVASVVVVVSVGVGVNWIRCHYITESCNYKWIKPENESKDILLNIFKKKLFGQHLAMKVVSSAVYNHIFDEHPQKALVMSFHGWTGSGKNYMCNLIAEYAYTKGMSSGFVHLKVATKDYPESGNVEWYKNELKAFIKTQSTACGRSIFIFDEMDKMPAGLLNVLKQFIDYYHEVDYVDHRKNIFIFLNNIGGNQIKEVAMKTFLQGKSREDINTTMMEYILSLASLKFHGGLENSSLILSGLIDFFVPFLPMERSHVKQCASAEIKRRLETSDFNLNEEKLKEIADKVAAEIQFFPTDENIYSISGCKQVTKKVDIYT